MGVPGSVPGGYPGNPDVLRDRQLFKTVDVMTLSFQLAHPMQPPERSVLNTEVYTSDWSSFGKTVNVLLLATGNSAFSLPGQCWEIRFGGRGGSGCYF